MTILFLSNNTISLTLYEWLCHRPEVDRIYRIANPIHPDTVKSYQPHLIISYNYKHIIKDDVIRLMDGNIINLHISYLPWNRGASPNIWSFLENTPKGVSIHQLDQGIDTGRLIAQRELFFDEKKETLESSYRKLNQAIVTLFTEHWNSIYAGTYRLIPQKGNGSYHTKADLQRLLHDTEPDYKMTIEQFRSKYRATDE